ncbi:C1_2 domain-containing protein [Psidium guajava]|nr:C1_2 domain-containing protein [Psidium guajava]
MLFAENFDGHACVCVGRTRVAKVKFQGLVMHVRVRVTRFRHGRMSSGYETFSIELRIIHHDIYMLEFKIS